MNGFEVFIFVIVPCVVFIGICWGICEALLEHAKRPYDWDRDG